MSSGKTLQEYHDSDINEMGLTLSWLDGSYLKKTELGSTGSPKSHYSFGHGCHVLIGSEVLVNSGNKWVKFFSLSQIKTWMELTKDINKYYLSVSTYNGDYNAAAQSFPSPIWWEKDSSYYQYFDSAFTGTVRVNYMITYYEV